MKIHGDKYKVRIITKSEVFLQLVDAKEKKTKIKNNDTLETEL